MESLDFDTLVEVSIEELRHKTAAHQGGWRLGQAQRWDLDQDQGNLVFTFDDGIVAECPAQIIGTYNADDGTWMWSWQNPSIVDPLKTDALKLKSVGEKYRIEKLTMPKWKCDEMEAWAMTAVACKLCEAQGAYRGPAGSTYVFMTFEKMVTCQLKILRHQKRVCACRGIWEWWL